MAVKVPQFPSKENASHRPASEHRELEGVEEYLDPLLESCTEVLDTIKLFEGSDLGHRKAFYIPSGLYL